MRKFIKRLATPYLPLAFLMFFAGLFYPEIQASANPIVPSGIIPDPGLPSLYFPNTIFRIGALLFFILIEALIFMRAAKLDFKMAFEISGLVNLISALTGIVMISPRFFNTWGWAVLIVILVLCIVKLKNLGVSPALWIVGLVCVVLGSVAFTAFRGFGEIWIDLWMKIILSLLLPFGIAIIVETVTINVYLPSKKFWKTVLMANLITYLLMGLTLPLYSPYLSRNNVVSGIPVNPPELHPSLIMPTEENQINSGLARAISDMESAVISNETYLMEYEEDESLQIVDRRWNLQNIQYKLDALYAIRDEDQEQLNKVYGEWVLWYLDAETPGVIQGRLHPGYTVERALRDYESELTMPPEPMGAPTDWD